MTSSYMVEARGVTKSFGDVQILRGVDFVLERGQVAALIGPSGSGKSTFLRCMNHLERIDGGELFVDGELLGYRREGNVLYELRTKELAANRAHIGMVFQSFNLFPHMTALENVIEAPLRVLRENRAQAVQRGRELLARVGLGEKCDSYPSQLSGGQQQRVAIARALAMKPKLMLFDEPTSALDPELVGEVLGVIKELADDGMSIVIVTHEFAFARRVADRVAVMADGLILEQGTAGQIFDRPEHPVSRGFLDKALGHR